MFLRLALVFAASIMVASLALSPRSVRADERGLTTIAKQLIADPQYLPDPKTGASHCNKFAHDLVDMFLSASIPELGGLPPHDYDANTIYTRLVLSSGQASSGWTDITDTANWQATYDRAAALAKAGSVVIAAYPEPSGPNPHGHLAIVMPGGQVPGYGGVYRVPVIAQAGVAQPNNEKCKKTNGVFMDLGLNCGFGPSKRPLIRFFSHAGH